jgi:hypothetical protein
LRGKKPTHIGANVLVVLMPNVAGTSSERSILRPHPLYPEV